ncbi:hypothetical protein IMCC12053_2626 [Celeribacter marinus]|uniref:Uncharacterized protein n=1 Tax=Celeribacter marinus TaxID=1397108 RepID=A0A0N7HIZ2_9RHOB|nr:hypothetical protein IMCC12053_2626 [Celeribacter marinus]
METRQTAILLVNTSTTNSTAPVSLAGRDAKFAGQILD